MQKKKSPILRNGIVSKCVGLLVFFELTIIGHSWRKMENFEFLEFYEWDGGRNSGIEVRVTMMGGGGKIREVGRRGLDAWWSVVYLTRTYLKM